jgi:hypothetical protein
MGELEEIVRSQLGDDRVCKVVVKHSQNSDGDDVVRVYVVYHGGKKSPTVEEMQDITDKLWGPTLRENRPELVVPSFISSEDDPDLRSA